MGVAEGIVKRYDNLLSSNGGHIEITKRWAKGFLNGMGFVKQRVSIKAKVNPDNFESYKRQFVFDVQTVIEMEGPKGTSNKLGSHRHTICTS